MPDLFSAPALFIVFRETLEAVIVISIMLQICDKLKLPHLKKHVWWGAMLGLGIAVCAAVVFICLFWVAKNKAFSGSGQTIFEGFMFLIASYLITIVAFAMLKFKNYEKKLEAKLTAAANVNTKAGKSGIFLLAFSTTLREGLETAVFITGSNSNGSAASIPLAGLVGLVCGLIIGFILYYTGKKVASIAWFMIGMAVIMFGLGAGLTARAVVAFQSVNWYGYAQLPMSARPWQTQQLWDWSSCCSGDITKNFFFGLISTLFGYTDAGTAMWLFAWFGYWVDIFLVLAIRGARGSLTDAKAKYDLKHGHDAAVVKAGNQVNRDLHPHHPELWGDAEDPKAAYQDPKLARSSDECSSTDSGTRASDEKPVPLQSNPKDIELSQV